MAFKPSQRSHNKFKEIPLDIRPVMNLMVVLIPILLYSAEFVKLSIRELNLPPASSGKIGPGEQKQEKEKRFGLTVLISKDGFYVGNKGGYLSGTGEENVSREEAQPTIAILEDGSYNFAELQKVLLEIKNKITGQGFVDEKSIIISAEADIPYKHVIRTIDHVTIYTDENGEQKELFPQINIGQIF
ncbi:MAG: hypothetical protein D6748_02600 [Calditrichaeota bacterium]|nr:MAG: hypothetical protein D6748_02600 [Calditrichota bacterium]